MATQKMTDQHPITPPPELIRKWNEEAATAPMADQRYIATQAARWGADQELEACCEWLCAVEIWKTGADRLRSNRRPKPPSLKEQALHALLHIDQGQHTERYHIIRRALEQLDD
jgi:hypothetical protein